jgi:ubiquilin
MVRSAARSTPVSGNASSSAAPTSAGTPASAGSAAQGVPSTFGAGQAYGSDPLAALNRADFAGPHMAALNRDLFQGFGMNPNDPNMLMTAMQSDDFRNQMRDMLSRPEVVDQIIASNPQLSQMPGVRELFRSEQFREMLVDPQSMARAAELSRQMGGMGGMGGMAGLGGIGGMGGMGQGAGAGAGQGGAAQWPPAGAFGGPTGATPSTDSTTPGGQQQPPAAAAGNPFAALMGGAGGQAGAPGGMFDPAL